MHLIHCLHFISAHYHFSISAIHIAGSYNIAADPSSKSNNELLLSLFTQACKTASPIPDPLIYMTLLEEPEWTSDHWKSLFDSITALV